MKVASTARPQALPRAPSPRGGLRLGHPLLPWLLGCATILFFTNLYPLYRLVERALATREGLTFANLGWLLTSPRVRTALEHSLLTSAAATAIALALGLALALVTVKTDLPGRRLVALAFLSPLIIPPQILALAWLQWAGPVGFVQSALRSAFDLQGRLWTLYGPGGIVLLLALFVLPVVYLIVVAGLARLTREVEEAAKLEGASTLQVWRFIVLPLVRPHLLAAAVLAFLGALGNFGIPALLAIPARYSTLPTLLYQEVIAFSAGGLGRSAALALLFGLPALLALWLQGRALLRSETRALASDEAPRLYRLGRWRWPCAALFALLTLLIVLGPLFAMAVAALTRAYGAGLGWENLTLEHFRVILFELGSVRRAALHSFALASGAALVATALAVILGYALTRLKHRALDALRLVIDLPYALPGLIFALALILVWLPSPIPGVSLYGTLWLLLIAYLGRFLAFALQPVAAAWRSLDTGLEEAASLDGASLAQSFRYVLLPLIAPSLLAAVLLVFLQALAELTLSALLVSSGSETLGWLVFGLEQGGYTQQAAALSTLLVLVLFAVALAVGLLRRYQAR
jgi:iron(III) transport system permease protein